MVRKKFETVEQYISAQSEVAVQRLLELRKIISQAAPDAVEVISYNMPAFKQNKILVYYAAAKSHIGFYPTPSPIVFFKEELKKYKTSKGAIQFPLDKKLPKTLIQKIVRYRVKEVAN